MHVLIVHAHPEPQSFNGALTRTAVETLQAAGHGVEVSDLYRMRFKAVAGPEDFTGPRQNPDRFDLAAEQTRACAEGSLSADIRAEQEKVARADLIIFQFPVWWFGMPAILKGWADRVFARGFAYIAGRKYDTGFFTGKLALVSVTTGTSADTYAPDGIDGDLNDILWPIHNGLFRYTGCDVLPPFAAFMPGRVSDEQRQAYLDAWADRLTTIETTPRLFFHPREDYGPDERLKPGVVARSGFQRNV